MAGYSPLAERYERVKAMIPPGVLLVAVSKTRSVEEIKALYDLGHRDFGENYAQELKAKQPQLPDDIHWHFIGHLQRSNVRGLLPFVHLIHGIDGEPLLDEVQKRSAAIGRITDVLLQIHIAQEETKHGLSMAEAHVLAKESVAHRWPNVRIRGLMGMATNTADERLVSAEFTGLAALFDELRLGFSGHESRFDMLSMGMSGDLQLALAAGSNLVRVGTAIFGERS